MNKIDYDVYHLSIQQWGLYLMEAVCACMGINYLFYKSTAVFFLYASVTFLVHTSEEKTTNPSEKEKVKLSV